jgi:MarR family transcriptional regulator, organic hydroperoxide resistance regulator
LSGEPLIYSLLELTRTLATRTETLLADVMAELDLTQPLADALWQLDPAAPPPAMRELAARLRCDPSTVTFLADRLEAKGLVTRQVDPHNRRVKTLHLTPQGLHARRSLVNAMATRSPMAGLSPDDQRRLHRLLVRAIASHQATSPR